MRIDADRNLENHMVIFDDSDNPWHWDSDVLFIDDDFDEDAIDRWSDND